MRNEDTGHVNHATDGWEGGWMSRMQGRMVWAVRQMRARCTKEWTRDVSHDLNFVTG